MHRQETLAQLDLYEQCWPSWPQQGGQPGVYQWPEEVAVLERFRRFIAATPGCFERQTQHGHLTGSALVVSADLGQVLLTLHRKLGKWLQLGGHADGHPALHEVALREAHEESGLSGLRFLPLGPVFGQEAALLPLPFDLDAHDIPARAAEPAHLHYDIRYVLVANRDEPLVISAESKDLRWFALEDAARLTSERSMQRQFAKLAWLKDELRLTEGGKALG